MSIDCCYMHERASISCPLIHRSLELIRQELDRLGVTPLCGQMDRSPVLVVHYGGVCSGHEEDPHDVVISLERGNVKDSLSLAVLGVHWSSSFYQGFTQRIISLTSSQM